jgi:gamma-glutamylputrescine oxidase
MSISYWLDKSSKTTEHFDVVIVGAGLAGFSTAYWLHKEDPSLKVAIVEKSTIGFGASGRNAGFITCGSVEHFNRLVGKHGEQEAGEIWDFSETNLKLLREHIIQDQGDKIEFEEKGSFSLASTENELTELKASSEIMKKMNIKVELVPGNEIKSRLGADNFVGGIKYCGDASVHPHKLVNLIRERGNATVFENHEVFNIETNSAGNKVIHTNRANFECQMVILATNGYSPLLHKYFETKIFPTKGQILVTEPVEKFMEGPCYANFVLDYFRQLPSGHMLIGGFRQLEKEIEVGYSDNTTEKIQKALEEFLNHHIPKVRNKKIMYRWSGIMGFSVDGQPLIGSLPEDNQFMFVGGFTGHGLGLSFHSAKSLVDVMFGRPIPKFVSAKRFS